mgnify:CR=1 FL=1
MNNMRIIDSHKLFRVCIEGESALYSQIQAVTDDSRMQLK